ncbi:MAG: Pyridine nucleotide-disulfide oxidoreductase, FAD/NAD(P)-binding domain protein [Actinomycetia bacterium]|nr:Pyridine nucleotide-disulfide oxidoreductase, FAD/NAD(P)-binding domain protein [Actinomycetes bacterium]
MTLSDHESAFADSGPRRIELVLLGAAAGLVSGLLVGALMASQTMFAGQAMGMVPGWALFALYAMPTGALLALVVGHRPHGVAVAASGGLLLGLLGWLAWYLTLDPLLRGHAPTWSAAAAGETYRELVGDLLHGTLAGVLFHSLVQGRVALRAGSGRATPAAAPPQPRPRVVIVGGGFGGVSTAQRFERLALRGHRVDVTLVSDSNFLLFTPMLAEVASGALEAQHISAPVRAAATHTRFRRGVVEEIDTERRVVRVATGSAELETMAYDHLVLAVGAVPHFLDLPGIAEHSFTLKSLADASGLRDHVLALLERADLEPDAEERSRQLTFVVAGGGFAGTETVAELFDLVHGVLHYFPGIHPDEPRFVLIHSRSTILPELSEELGRYALAKLRARGIEFRLGVRAAEATAQDVRLSDGERIATRTFVWTAGNRPSPLLAALPGERGRGGSLVVDAAFRAVGIDRVWAIGDCAQIPDLDDDGAPFPPTAQHALREGKVAADNIAAVLKGRKPKAFRFRTIGIFVALGHRTAAGEIRGRRFSGLAAWLMWRGIYLAKLPGIEKRVRVLFDWTLDLAFPRDIVVTAPPPHSPSLSGAQTGEAS